MDNIKTRTSSFFHINKGNPGRRSHQILALLTVVAWKYDRRLSDRLSDLKRIPKKGLTTQGVLQKMKKETAGEPLELRFPYGFIWTFQNKHSEERTADKEVPLSSEEQALHDELVSSDDSGNILLKFLMMLKGMLLKRRKEEIALEKGKEHVPQKYLTLRTWRDEQDQVLFSRIKHGLVAQGYRQEDGVDYDVKFLHQWMSKVHFYMANITEEVYCKKPPGFMWMILFVDLLAFYGEGFLKISYAKGIQDEFNGQSDYDWGNSMLDDLLQETVSISSVGRPRFLANARNKLLWLFIYKGEYYSSWNVVVLRGITALAAEVAHSESYSFLGLKVLKGCSRVPLLKKLKKRGKKQKKKVSSVKLGRNNDEDAVGAVTPDLERKSDETEQVIIEEENDTSDVKSRDTEELDLERIQIKDDEFLADISLNISRPRGLSIPGPMQSQPQQPTQTTDPKEKDSLKDFIPMGSKKRKAMLQERYAKRLLRKRKATVTEEQPSKKLKLRTEKIDELRNYLRIVDFEKSAQDRESLEAISMITEFKVDDSPMTGFYIIYILVVQGLFLSIFTRVGLILLSDLTTIIGTSLLSTYIRVRGWYNASYAGRKKISSIKRADDQDARSCPAQTGYSVKTYQIRSMFTVWHYYLFYGTKGNDSPRVNGYLRLYLEDEDCMMLKQRCPNHLKNLKSKGVDSRVRGVRNPSVSTAVGVAIGDGTVKGIIGDEMGDGSSDDDGEMGSELDVYSGEGGVCTGGAGGG
ncbi:hypothetical protein Tco_0008325 [Tanacetum coccineum]